MKILKLVTPRSTTLRNFRDRLGRRIENRDVKAVVDDRAAARFVVPF